MVDGFTEESDCVTMDDFYGWLKYDELLKIADRYSYRVPVKGSFANFMAKTLVITSNKPISNWYHFNGYQTAAIDGRVEHYFLNEIPEICMFVDQHPEGCPKCQPPVVEADVHQQMEIGQDDILERFMPAYSKELYSYPSNRVVNIYLL